jgi:hypothetical protein
LDGCGKQVVGDFTQYRDGRAQVEVANYLQAPRITNFLAVLVCAPFIELYDLSS